MKVKHFLQTADKKPCEKNDNCLGVFNIECISLKNGIVILFILLIYINIKYIF